ncbi:hypothetical protein ACH6EH_06630 [Paenibacillus sp. JSM ZJ436]|uniref:hypothetical protein n=1 Tax=Paenibacillus sp. JSM ZJ436 TaxID=3376190 RepID=UPI0037B6D9ED
MAYIKEDIELKLKAGLPIPIDNAGLMRIPTFRVIADIGLSIYNLYLAYLLIDKNSLDKQMNKNMTNFDLFFANCYHSEEFKHIAFNGLQLFFNHEPSLEINGEDYFINLEGQGFLNRENFMDFQEILMISNNVKVSNEPEYKPGNSKAQEMINMIMKNRKKQPKLKEKMNLQSIVSALAWKENGLTIFSVFDLNIYQIYDGFHTTNNIDNYKHTIQGLYAGTIDSKNIKLADIHWANKINN